MFSGMKVAVVLVAALLAFITLGSFGSSKKSPEPKSSSTTPTSSVFDGPSSVAAKPTGKVAAPAGSTVRDGKFEFKVLGVTRGATSKDGGFGTTDNAKGEYFSVRLQVTNIGDDARTLFASNQHLIVNGNKYDATSHITDDGWKEDINPGLGSTTTATFDIPAGSTPTAIECHDSAFSGGALLAL